MPPKSHNPSHCVGAFPFYALIDMVSTEDYYSVKGLGIRKEETIHAR